MPFRVEPGGEPIPGYKLIDRLGGGGFGEVWKVEAPGGLHKAMKIVYGDLQTTDPDGTRRAEQELKALKRVQSVRHPYLLSLERYDIVDNRLVIVMELADRNLWDRFRECRGQNQQGIPREELLRYMEESAEVLDLMNTQYQLQHLDIKPQNLFLVHNHAKVADFGLVKDLEGMMATVTGGITPVYAAPETFDGVVSRYCDQYSLAIVYQELLTGQRPFNGSSLQQLIMQHLSAMPNVTPLPEPDRAPINRSLAKKPEGRFPSCLDLVRALRAGSSTEVVAVKPSSRPIPAVATTEQRPSGIAAHRPESSRASTHTIDGPAALHAEMSSPAPVEQTGPPVQDLPPLAVAPPEIKGDGVLCPAVVIGLGQKGLEVLAHLREAVEERFGSLHALPNLRLLYIDTDPDAVHAATHGAAPVIDPSQTILARLNRPSHYLKPREGRPLVDSWFSQKLLYRIPRNPVTTGIRALGRLAFIDHYRAIAGRIRTDLESCGQPDVLAKAKRHTRLGMRTNYPRVYVVSGLAGGTGSGMFLDMGYVVANLMRNLGYVHPEVVGIGFVPEPAGDRPTSSTVAALGNTVATLTELNHFSQPEATFSFRFDDREPKLKDRDPPFRRTVLVPLEPENNPDRAGEATRLIGDYLVRELTTPLGRTADAARLLARSKAEALDEVTFESLSLFRFTWPRRTLLQLASRHLCHELSQHWMSKDAAPVREPVRNFLAEELTRQELDPSNLLAQLQAACTQALGQAPETIFASLVEPFVPKGRKPPDPDGNAVLDALRRMEQLVGKPKDDPAKVRDSLLGAAMDAATGELLKAWSEKLSQIVLGLIEKPDFRLAGTEEALKQLSETVGRVVEHHESLCKDLIDRAADAYTRVQQTVDALRASPNNPRRNAPLVEALVEALRAFPKQRFQALQLRRVAELYVSLRGQLSEQMREVNFCRNRLSELVHTFEEGASVGGAFEPVPGICLLPSGCRTLDDAIQRLLDTLGPRDFRDLDQRLQETIEEQFTSLLHVCLASDDLVRELAVAMQQQAEAFMGSRLVGTNVVEMFLTQHPRTEDALEDIATAFKEARPPLVDPEEEAVEVRILALPPGPLGEQFRSLAQQALPNAGLTVTESAEDIVIYRECPNVPLTELRVLGAPGQAAYRQMNSTEHFPAHSRSDVTDWQPLR